MRVPTASRPKYVPLPRFRITASPSSSRKTTSSGIVTVASSDNVMASPCESQDGRRARSQPRAAGRRLESGTSTDERPEQDATGGRMLEERADEMAVLVELRRLADERHDAVGLRQIEQAVD